MQNIMGSFWVALGVMALVLCACAVPLWWMGDTGFMKALLWTSGGALLALALNAHPLDMIQSWWRRFRHTIHLKEPMDLRSAPSKTNRVVLDDEGSSVSLRTGEVIHHHEALDLSSVKLVELHTQGKSRFTDRALEDFSLRFWATARPRPEDTPLFQIEVPCHPAMVPRLYGTLWTLCQVRELGLRAPSGTWSAADLRKPLSERLRGPMEWARNNFSEPKEGAVPFLEPTEDGAIRYAFPLYRAKGTRDVMEKWAQSLFHDLNFLTWVSAMGLVTFPLAWVSHKLLDRLDAYHEVVVELREDQIIINGHAEPISDVVMFSILPVHPGAPVLLTRKQAVLLGGLTSYEDRVACGLHMLQALHRALPQNQQEHQTRGEPPQTHPPQMMLTEELLGTWTPDLSSSSTPTGRGAAVFLFLLALGSSVVNWLPWAKIHAHLPTLSPHVQNYHLMTGIMMLGVFLLLLQMLPRGKRVRVVLASPLIISTVMAPLLVLSWAVTASEDLSKLSFVEANLNDFSFRRMDLSSTNFGRADVADVSMDGAKLQETNFQGAHLLKVSMKDVQAAKIEFNQATLYEVVLDGATLDQADFSNATLSGVNAKEARMTDSVLRRSKWSGFDLSGADLSGATLKGAHFEGGSMINASLMAADLSDTTFKRVNLTGVRVEGPEGERGAKLCRVKIDQDSICADGRRAETRLAHRCFGFKDILKGMLPDENCH